MYYVYVLKSDKNGRFYIGSTNNIQRRLLEHNTGKSRYTKSTIPFRLIYKEIYETRKEAVKRERALKSGQGRQSLKDFVRTVA
ncbi:GIY-YIG nuclease family protein [Patescibacteria group bacterium]|nr:GIY-YIG nuclease family protein [Patescibacteria group bacterium]